MTYSQKVYDRVLELYLKRKRPLGPSETCSEYCELQYSSQGCTKKCAIDYYNNNDIPGTQTLEKLLPIVIRKEKLKKLLDSPATPS